MAPGPGRLPALVRTMWPMRRPAILALGLLGGVLLLAGLWLTRSRPLEAGRIAPRAEAQSTSAGEREAETPSLAPVEPDRSPAPPAAQGALAEATTLPSTPEAGTIQGRVVSPSGEPLEGARVEAEIQSDGDEDLDAPVPEAVSDNQGRFTIEGCKHDGQYELKPNLDGWWPVERVIRPTGATDVELVLQRGGGIRGQVIEALDSSVEDYIVVARYEQPPVEWTPERMARIERAFRRDLRKQVQMQVLMQDLGPESKPEQRPDGEAWTLLDPDGRFELTNVRPGKSSVIIAARNRTRGLATIAGVDVQPGIVTEDARLDPVNMNEHACVYRATIVDPGGLAVQQGTLEVLPSEKDAHGKFFIEFKDGAARFLGPLWIDQVQVEADGHAPFILRGPPQTLSVMLTQRLTTQPAKVED